MSDNIPNIAFVSNITTDEDGTSAIFHPEADLMSRGNIREFMNTFKDLKSTIIELKNEKRENEACHKRDMEKLMEMHKNDIREMQRGHTIKMKDMETRIEKLVKTHENETREMQKKHEVEVQQLTAELKEWMKKNKMLEKHLDDAIKRCTTAEAKIQTLEKEARKTEPSKGKAKCEELVVNDEKFQDKLTQCGVKKMNWWKVLALGLALGILGVATGGGIVMGFVGAAVITGKVAACAGIGGAVIGGVGGYAHENKRLRSEKKLK